MIFVDVDKMGTSGLVPAESARQDEQVMMLIRRVDHTRGLGDAPWTEWVEGPVSRTEAEARRARATMPPDEEEDDGQALSCWHESTVTVDIVPLSEHERGMTDMHASVREYLTSRDDA